jgi:hypothetical protein
MERTLVKLLKKRWLVGNEPSIAMYTFRRIIEEISNFNLFPKLNRIRRSKSCPYFFSV